jgi:hypothetical protein
VAAAEPPNPWSVIVDYSKAIITLAAGLLGVTVTFADRILGSTATTTQVWGLVVSWAFLLVAVLSGVLAAAFCINQLKSGTRGNLSVLAANVAFFALLVATAALLVVGWSGAFVSREETIEQVISRSRGVVAAAGGPGRHWDVEAIEWIPTARQYRTVLRAQATNETFTVIVDVGGRVVSITRSLQP